MLAQSGKTTEFLFGLGRSIEPSCFVTEFLLGFVCTIVVTEFYRVFVTRRLVVFFCYFAEFSSSGDAEARSADTETF